MLLQTNLKHLATAADVEKAINENENVMVCCGRMGPMCIPVYGSMEQLEKGGKYDHVTFYDMAFDSSESAIIRNLPECRGFMGLPFVVYYKNGKVAHAVSSIQSMEMITKVLDSKLTK